MRAESLFGEGKRPASDPMTEDANPDYAVRDTEWRAADRLHEAACEFTDHAYESEFEVPTAARLMKIGGQLVASCDVDIRDALRQLQNVGMRTGALSTTGTGYEMRYPRFSWGVVWNPPNMGITHFPRRNTLRAVGLWLPAQPSAVLDHRAETVGRCYEWAYVCVSESKIRQRAYQCDAARPGVGGTPRPHHINRYASD